jgi:predicted metal-binding protein
MTNMLQDLKTLCDRALELGASAARSVSAREVAVDPRVQLKCRVPLCGSYGQNLMCPPHVMPPEQFAAILQRYAQCVVVQQAIPLTADDLKRRFRGKTLEQLVGTKAYNKALADSQNGFVELLTVLEAEAMGMGYRFAAALAGGDCCLCETCVAAVTGDETTGACLHPFKARPSMEALGIDVVRTAECAGLPIEFPAGEHPVWTGLLLVD